MGLPILQSAIAAGGGQGVSDHGQLTGLADDDHTQYQKKSEKGSASGYCGLDGSSKVAIGNLPTGSSSSTVCIGNDSRLSDARTPTAHASTHRFGQTDSIFTFSKSLAGNASTGANTTPIDLTDLVFSYETNAVYRIWFCGDVSAAAATTGCGFQFNVSSAVTSVDLIFYHQLANTGTLSGGHSIADDASQGVSSGIPANGGTYTVAGTGLLRTGANTGTAQLRFRSETTAVITAKAGLTLCVERIL